MTQPQWGETLFAARGCTGCHSIVGARNVGPPLNGLMGTERFLVDGSTQTVDLAYLRSALVSPSSAVPVGYEDEMPSYGSLLDDDEMDAVIAYLGTL